MAVVAFEAESGKEPELIASHLANGSGDPIEATLKILLSSVPYLVGAAVVRQPPAGDAVAAQLGRMPWLEDRRLMALELPDDTLPANRAIFLDWPVPHQAEWVGTPPRLLISRLVARERTVGVLLGTLTSREQMSPQTREALDMSCELIATAVGSDSFSALAHADADTVARDVAESSPTVVADVAAEEAVEESRDERDEEDERDALAADEVARALDGLDDARSVGRVLRDAVTAISEVDGFAISLFHTTRREVAYRYKVVGSDGESTQMGRQPVDDSPSCYAARRERRWHAYMREIAVRGARSFEARKIAVIQYPLVDADEVFGVATLERFGETPYSDHEMRLTGRILEVASERLAPLRRAGRFQPRLSPPESAAAAVLPPVAAAPSSSRSRRAPEAATTDEILTDLLAACEAVGLPTAFMVGIDPAAELIRGELISRSPEARELDYALGISSGRFAVELADRYNAIARACREGRVVTASTLAELVRDRESESVATLERIVTGRRATVIPIAVSGEIVGALVVGPMADDVPPGALGKIRELVIETAVRLADAWEANR